MKVKELKKLLESVNNDIEIVCPANDHAYYRSTAYVVTAESNDNSVYLGEYHSGNKLNHPNAKLVRVLLVC